MRFPSIQDVARELRAVNNFADDECDVRLQVEADGSWAVRYGDSSYDQSHLGYWGASSVPGSGRRFPSISTASDLLEQAKEQYACEVAE